MEISIIVPVYNAENYIEECIESILNQTFTDFELILIDDGSIDNSVNLIKRYQFIDKRIVLIEKENEGVSKTRNLGILNSRGRYIIFIDSDDYIDDNMLDIMYRCIIENKDSDMVICGYSIVGNNDMGNDTYVLNTLNKKLICKNKILEYYLSNITRITGFSVRTLYKKEILLRDSIFFSEKLNIFEDYQFVLRYISSVRNVYVISDELYYYRRNNDSVTNKYINNMEHNIVYFNDWFYSQFVKINYNKYIYTYYDFICNGYNSIIKNIDKKYKFNNLILNIKEIYKKKKQYNIRFYLKETIKYNFNNLNKSKRIYYILFYFNLEFVYILLHKLNTFFKKNIKRKL